MAHARSRARVSPLFYFLEKKGEEVVNSLVPFDFEGRAVRTITDESGLTWFVAADICAILELANTSRTLDRLDLDEKGITTVNTLGGNQVLATVNEAGLYRLILTSRKEAARRFSRWVTHEVLPAIRKHGRYSLPGADHRDVANRADLMVASWRIFNACLRVCRRIGMERRRAYAEAIDCARRETGIDWSQKVSVDLGIDTLPTEMDPRPDSEVALFLQRWKEGDLGIPYSPMLSRELFRHYAESCAQQGIRALTRPRFVHAVKRQFGRCCNPRRRWLDNAGVVHGPNGFIDPPGVAVVEMAVLETTPCVHNADGEVIRSVN